MPRAVVTGGAGFLGSHLCDRLLSEGWDVLCLDSFLTALQHPQTEEYWGNVNARSHGPGESGEPGGGKGSRAGPADDRASRLSSDVTFEPAGGRSTGPVPDITRAREVLGWEPRSSLREGMEKTIEWARHAWLSGDPH